MVLSGGLPAAEEPRDGEEVAGEHCVSRGGGGQGHQAAGTQPRPWPGGAGSTVHGQKVTLGQDYSGQNCWQRNERSKGKMTKKLHMERSVVIETADKEMNETKSRSYK